jgi:hypothetical protein
MPNPRNRLKLTGDTHLPDVGDDGTDDGDVLAFEPAQADERDSPMREAMPSPAYGGSAGGYLEMARTQVRQRPVAALAGAFVLGLLLARV